MEIISIVIISYNRPEETIESIQNVIFDTEDIEGFQKEVIVINNGSTVDYSILEEFIIEKKLNVNYINHNKNLGVSGGRNLGIENSNGKYVVFIDDDAVFKTKDSLKVLHSKFQEYNSQNVGIIAFGVENFYTREEDHPVKNKTNLEKDEFLNNIFWGTGFVVKKEVFNEIGMFDDSFFYGMEEYDLAYRTMDKGFKILFTKNICVLHKVSPKGREINIVKHLRMFEHKCLVAYRFLPWKYVMTHIFMWSSFFLVKSRGNIFYLFKGMISLLKKIKVNKRQKISKKTITYIQSVSGRLTY